MPIYMDRHDVSEQVTAEIVAELHQQDLKVQDQFGCRALTYWYDDKRKTAFCLVEAPDEASLKNMHDHAHGQVPHSIIPVEPGLVEAFLGRVQDPGHLPGTHSLVIDEPAFRAIMLVSSEGYLSHDNVSKSKHDRMEAIIRNQGGSVVRNVAHEILASFRSVLTAVKAGKELLAAEAACPNKNLLSIAITVGSPVNGQQPIFAETVQRANKLSRLVEGNLVLSAEAYETFVSENEEPTGPRPGFIAINEREEKFLLSFIDHLETSFQQAELTVTDFSLATGMSKSQLYRMLVRITGMSPNELVQVFRLKTAAAQLHKKVSKSVSEVAYEVGFTSPSYFSKCFRKRYNILPSALQAKEGI